ncbi:jg10299 [Pararge aegeria aegeria]|uniref:Jg10299 protein n=1 Tax=Pararge aegeria aegeria TaxID=348720 RepID=A0A8S4SB99_9NEOP|nr:jg10299 [Pararge aegeria aegeria]
MSEAIDIDTDNICTTEDAFEQFQSVSMYEENEFITLSDIVAPPPPNPDISEILHEIPTEDVSPLLLVEEPLNQVTSTTGQNVQETTPKKRGRKKKINVEASAPRESAECTALTDSEHSKNNVTSQGLELENNASNTVQTLPETPIDTTPLVQPLKRSKRQYNRQATKKQAIQQKKIKKRGRKPKNIKVPTPSTNNENYNVTDIVNNSSNIKEPMEKKQLNTSKRGRRKKKIPSELNESSNEIIIEPEINSDLASPADQARLPNENVEKEPKKGKRVKKNDIKQQSFDEIVVEKQKSDNQELVSNELTDDDIEDVPLMVLSNKMVLSNNVEKTDSTNFDLGTENDLLKEITPPIETNDDIILVQRTPRKRGRPKKVDSNNSIHIKSSEDENDITATNSIVKSHTDVPGLNNSKDCTNETVAKKNYIECTENIDDDDDVIKKESTQSDFYNKRNSKKPNMSDFEYNIDSIIKNDHPEDNVHQQFSDHSDTKTGESSKRPIRRKVKKNLHYDEGSDEDPYANIELSDDEPRRRKGGRYHSDDEYIPGSKRQLSDLSDSDIDIDEEVEDEEDLLNDSTKQKSRKYKRSETGLIKSPRKKAKKGDKSKPNNLDVFTQKPTIEDGNGDLEDLLETSIIKTSDDTPKAWGTTKEFKDFLDKISQGTDIKIKKAKSMDNSKTLLQIPVLDQNEAKKTAEMCAQTDTIKTKSISVQTSSVYEVPMKNQVSLTAHQSDKACEFLSGIVKTTAELGQLMTQKSEDFIEKKINTTYVTDTIKMDYCVKKSFLLFRLAKHNLVQMEEDLAKQYQEFLQENNLIQHREEQKIIESTSKAANSDSDCEIVEEPVLKDKEVKSVFNPKTVFLNKELSIKIAKKHSEEPKPKEKLNIKGRHTVWINDSIMVKKVKPTQSFLAQDSRNKKPPDTYITLEMVSDFFKIYNRQKAISICAQFVRPEWCNLKQNYSCCYFYDKTCESSESSTQFDNTEELTTEVPITENNLQNLNDIKCLNRICPNSLLTLCTKVIQKMMSAEDIATKNIYYLTENIEPSMINPCNLQNTCNDGTKDVKHFSISNNDHKNQLSANIGHLKTLCYKKLIELICLPDFSESNVKKKLSHDSKTKNHEVVEDFCNEKPECSAVMEKVKPLFSLCLNIIVQVSQEALDTSNLVVENKIFFQPNSLKCLVFSEVKNMFYNRMCKNNNFVEKENSVTKIGRDFIPTESKLDKDDISHKLKPTSLLSLKSLCIDVVNDHIFGRLKQSSPISLNSLCVHIINKILIGNYSYEEINIVSHIGSPNFTINDVNTVSEDVFLNNTSEDYIEDNQIEPTYLEEEENNFSDDCEANYDNSLAGDDNNWVSQVQMQELRSFVEPTITSDREKSPQAPDFFSNGAVNIKVEPADELSENIAESYVKLEPLDEEDTTFMPLVTITKQEVIEATGSSKEPNVRENSNSYDENTFEAFVSSNKMIMSLNSYETDNDDIFTQSTSRVRRQHEPDSDGEVENFADSLNLLVPQNIETAKDRLMASSSDEDTNRKKKPEKRGRGRPKRSTKTNIAAPVKENVTSKSDLAVLTRKMREKIRQVEKQNESSESELEDTDLRVTKDKEKIKDKPQKKQSNVNIDPEKEIQCNDVDSTEQINENDAQQNENAHHEVNQTAVNYDSDKAALSFDKEQNLHDDEDRQVMDMDDMSYSPLIDANEPVEMLECEPTLPIFDTCVENTHIKRKPKLQIGGSRPGPACSKRNYIAPYINCPDWNRYPIDTKDNKIYCHTQIMLHKLPESFVQTYLKYQNLSMQSKDDSEVDKLINLQSLHRNQSKEKGHLKVKDVKNASIDHGKTKSSDVESVTQTNIKVEHFEELLPSEDEGDNTEDIQPMVTSQPTADNCLAKDFLMNDEAEICALMCSVDDAKRAKIVSEFIEKRSDGPQIRLRSRPPRRRSMKKLMEKRKQMKILTRELLGDDASHPGKKSYQTYGKGRRNIRKVLTHPRVGMQRVLVCCPLSTVLNWVDEIHKWIGPVKEQIKNRKFKRKLQVFELSKLKKTYERAYQLEDWYNGGGIFIIGYELFRSLSTLDPVLDCVRTTILNKIRTALLDPGPDIVICDEGHLLKNDCSVLAVAMSRVKTRRRIILTGTPMQNNLREYYCMVNFVKPSLLGSYSEYSNRFENPIMNGQHRDSIEEDIKLMKARTHILHKVLEGCLQRQEASVLYPYLPKKHEYTVFVSLTKSQRELYTHYLTNYAKETKQSVLKDFHVLQKIWTHPQVLHNFFMKSRDEEKQQKIKVEKEDDLVAEDLGASEDTKPSTMETWWLPYVAESEVLDALHSSNKFLVIFRLLDECIALGDKVLIFSTSLYTMDALEYFLRRINNWSLGREYYRLDGSVPAEVRQKWCREFNAESNTGTKLFLISTRAGSLGLNMTAANRVVILDTSWNPAHDIQSIFRVYRFGQKKDCYIYRLVAMGTMEQKIYERSVTKQAVACRVVDEQQIDRHYNMSELTELYRLDEDGAGVAAGLAAGVRDAALLRVAASDTPCGPLLYAVHEHDSLLRGSGEIGLAEDERAAVWSQFQEEHANKHIQSIALKLPKKEFDPKIPKSENAQNDANNQSVPGGSDTKPKSKRGRKPLQACKNMPVQPSTSSQDELFAKPKLEKSMIQKIMDILIQHNFHTTNGPKEISELIQNVQKTVSNPKRGRLRNIDPVTASIARVLIEEGTISIPPPAFTGTNVNQSQYLEPTESAETIVGTPADYNSIYCVDQNQETNIQSEYSSRKRRRQRKEADTTLNQEQTTIGETHSTETIVGTPVENSIYFEVPKIQETQESVDSDHPERKRRRNRRESDEEYIPDKQKIKNMPTDKLKHNTRKSNEYNLSLASVNNDETITSDLPSVSITLPDTEESQVTLLANQKNLMKNEKEKKRKTSKKKSKQENLSYIEKETASQQGIIEKLIIKQTVNDESEPVNAIESILLSDEDEPLVAAPVTAPDVQAAASRIKVVKQQSNQQNDQSPIPLHKSLLTNKNFIKIVAHTYLTGKPQLAEDAAILAAQYSTLKALKELEATNKDIVSGPIYDIAVQVLGKDLLKKLHNASAPKKDSGTIRPSTVPDQSENDKKSNKNKSVNDSEVVPQTKIKKKPQNHIERTITLIDDDILTPSTSSSVRKSKKAGPKSVAALEVVPVEMFEVPSTLRSRYPSQDECILPDDDDDFIVSDSPNIVSQSQTHRNQRNSQPTSINLSSINTDRIATRPKVVQIVQKQPVVNPIPLPPPPVVLNTISKPFSKESQCGSSVQTICLDSDEEVAPVEPVETATRKVLKSTTKLPHSSSSNTADSEAVTVKQQSKFTTLLDKKKKIVQVNATNSEPSKKAKSPNIRAPSQNISVTSDESVFIIAHNVSEEDGPLSVMKSKCMPGDIMRINKDGMIEILNKTDTAPAAINANKPHAVNASASDSCVEILPEESVKEPINRVKTTALSSNKKTPANSKPICNKKTPATTNKTINPTKAPATTHKTINLTKTPTFGSSSSKFKATENTSYVIESTERARKSYPSSNDNLRSESPDPLSVLQNVVHIPADKYQANKQMNTKESYSRQKSSTFIVTKTADSNMARASSDLAVKRAEALLKSYDSTKSQNKAAKVIDLTEAFAAASEVPRPTPTKKGSTAPIKLVTNIKISGTSKDILINNAGAVSNAKNKPSTSFDSSKKSNANPKKILVIPPQKPPANDVSKRPSPWQDSIPSKKKKSEGNSKFYTFHVLIFS